MRLGFSSVGTSHLGSLPPSMSISSVSLMDSVNVSVPTGPSLTDFPVIRYQCPGGT